MREGDKATITGLRKPEKAPANETDEADEQEVRKKGKPAAIAKKKVLAHAALRPRSCSGR